MENLQSKRKSPLVVAAVAGLSLIAACVATGTTIPMERQLTLLGHLRDTTSVVFTIAGIWIALVYPAALPKAAENELTTPASAGTNSKDNRQMARRLVDVMLATTITLGYSVLLPFLVEFVRGVPRFAVWRDHLRCGSMAIMGSLLVSVIWTLIVCLHPLRQALKDLRLADRADRTASLTAPAKPTSKK